MQLTNLIATALFISGWLAIGCEPSNKTTKPQIPVSVKASQSTRIGQDMTVQVTSIQDSRCPADAMCTRNGSVQVEFVLEKEGTRQMGKLCLGECGQDPNSTDTTAVQLGDHTYHVVLKEVRPYPGTSASDTKPEALIQLLN